MDAKARRNLGWVLLGALAAIAGAVARQSSDALGATLFCAAILMGGVGGLNLALDLIRSQPDDA